MDPESASLYLFCPSSLCSSASAVTSVTPPNSSPSRGEDGEDDLRGGLPLSLTCRSPTRDLACPPTPPREEDSNNNPAATKAKNRRKRQGPHKAAVRSVALAEKDEVKATAEATPLFSCRFHCLFQSCDLNAVRRHEEAKHAAERSTIKDERQDIVGGGV